MREEAGFWESHCRNATPGDAESRPVPARAGGTVWERIARADALARAGNAAGARADCLDLEADARAVGAFSPILYRLLRLASEGEGPRNADPGSRFAEWSAAAGPSPERALARGLFAALPRPEAAPEPPAEPALFAVPAESSEVAARAPAADTLLPVEPGGPPPAESFEIQLGSYEDGERARLAAERLRGLGLQVRVVEVSSERGPLYKLRWGSFRNRDEAEESARTRCTGLEWMIVRAGTPSP
jgi:cell division septation protein DedD